MTPAPLRPRELAWRGRVDAAAFWFPVRDGVVSEVEARRRVLALWTPGTVVYALDGGDLLALLPSPARGVRVETAPGTPLVRVPDAGPLCAAPPATPAVAKRLRALAPGPGETVVLVRGGAWEAVTLDPSRAVDPAAWLDPGDVTVEADVESLGAPPAPVVDALPPAAFDPRAAYGKVAADDPPAGLADLLAALKDGPKAAATPKPNPLASATGAFGAGLLGLLDRLAERMRPPVMTQNGDGRVRSGQSTAPAPGGAPGGTADPLAWLRWAAARLAGLAGFGGVIGRKQADYVRRMLEMFERGDLDEALRHAIPLGGDADDPLKRLPPALFAPKPRADLSITPGGSKISASLGFSGDLHEHLRSLYRKTFERLERDGRIDEAAFVLAELLQDTEGAVNFLEKHGRLSLAADMAEARGLPPAWVVRLRFLAGDIPRALAYARRTGAWGDAVAQLERRLPCKYEARRLRLEWAASLARAGDYAGAVDVASPVPEAGNLILGWMERVVAGGGVPAARMMARRLAASPDDDPAYPAWRADALALLEADDPATAAEREAFLLGVVPLSDWSRPGAAPVRRALARGGVRTAARDLAAGLLSPSRKALYESLLALAADPALKTDAVPFADLLAARPGEARHRSLRDADPAAPPIVLSAADVGLVAVEDAAHLPTGRTLVALGERGVRLVSADGRTVREWPTVPAHRLVPADSGNVAVALARRGYLWSLTRLDLITGAATPWGEAEIPVFAPDSDGSVWMVALPNGGGTQALTALDLQGPPDRLASLWRLPLEGGEFRAIARSPVACVAVWADVVLMGSLGPGGPDPRPFHISTVWERWRLEMPSLTVRGRELWETTTEARGFQGPFEMGMRARAAVASLDSGMTVHAAVTPIDVWPGPVGRRVELYTPQGEEPILDLGEYRDARPIPTEPVAGGGWLADIRRPVDGTLALDLLSLAAAKPGIAPATLLRLRLIAEGAENLGARLFAGHLTVWDDRGRVLAFHLDSGDRRTDLRLR